VTDTDKAPPNKIRKPSRKIWIAVAAVAAVAAAVCVRVGMASIPPTLADLAYGVVSKQQQLDLYRPAGAGPFPVVVYVHGGAFKFGDKRDIGGFSADVKRLNGAGIAVASINYRMSGEAAFPAAVVDTRGAVRWLRAHANELQLDPGRIGLWGKSAGANLVLEVALTPGDASLDDPRLGLADVSDRVQAVVAMYAPTDFLTMDEQARARGCSSRDISHDNADSPESLYIGAPIQSAKDRARAASPVTHVSATSPPMLLQAGTADCTVPYRQSQELQDAIVRVGDPARVQLSLLPGASHADSAFDKDPNLTTVVNFLRDNLLHAPTGP